MATKRGMHVLSIVLLSGCAGKANVIQSVELSSSTTIPAVGTPVGVYVKGVGVCPGLAIDWGDGAVDFPGGPYDLATPARLSHTYSVWGGGKTVTAMATTNACAGRANTRFKLPPVVNKFPFPQLSPPPATGRPPCRPLPGAFTAPLPVPTLVHLTTIPTANGTDLIDYGCPFQGCRYNADGKAGSVATAPFPFPGLKEYSLVLRVGTELFQGGTDVRFTPAQNAMLEICLNDDAPTRNRTGGYEIHIEVNQLGPPPP